MFLSMVVLLGMLQFSPLPEANEVTVIDGGRFRPYKFTEFDAGPAAGNGLNGHFFPSVIAYNTGRYNYALQDFTYIVRNQSFLDENPRKAEFMSITHYLRGMIYLYHATGVGRHALAKLDFEKAIEWNPGNHMAYLELARIYSVLGFSKEAVAVIDHLLELKPAEDILSEARDELAKLPKASSQ